MPAPAPAYCRPEAYELFAASVQQLDSSDGLLMAAVAISMHELDDVDPAAVDRQLQDYVDTVHSRVHGGHEPALLAHTHQLLFDEAGFTGNTANYYDRANSYLPSVLHGKTGLPITLSLIYKTVLDRLGVSVHGINAPGHFMVRVDASDGPMLVDPFVGGRVLSIEEACQRSSAAVQQPALAPGEVLSVATHRQWVGRILRNLYAAFLQRSRTEDLGAIAELGRLLKGDGPI